MWTRPFGPILDDIADVVTAEREGPVRRPLASQSFDDLVPPERRTGFWADLAVRLDIVLPPLDRVRADGPDFPVVCSTVAASIDRSAARFLPVERLLPTQPVDAGLPTSRQWIEAQVFVVVRDMLVDSLGVDKKSVHRRARLIEDLGAE